MIGDLYVVPTLIIKNSNGEDGTIKIGNGLLNKYGVEFDELIDMAVENAKRIAPAEVKTMLDTLLEVTGASMEMLEDAGFVYALTACPVLVVTNTKRFNGASAILYAEDLPSEFYMFPSSRHEVIIVPAGQGMDMEENEMVDMVRAVNSKEVAPEDRLSDNAYYYNNGEWRVIS
jgi:hypothetical protein